MARPVNIHTDYFEENGINYEGHETRFYMDDYFKVPIRSKNNEIENFDVQLRHIYDPYHPYGGVCLASHTYRCEGDKDGFIVACAVECSSKDLYSRDIGRELVWRLFAYLVNFLESYEDHPGEDPCLNYRQHAITGTLRMDDPEGATCGNDFMDEVAYLLCPSAYHKYL